MSISYRQQAAWKSTFFIGGFLLVMCALLVLFNTYPSHALQTTPYKLNYQGRLTDATGTAKPDGQYNMTFRLYSALTGGSAIWTETRETTNRVTVTGGQFAVQLGTVTALSPNLFTTQPLYLEVELPTPATATCSTASCGVYTEGAMTPRQAMASSAYTMNADTLDGLDSSEFARLDVNNTFTKNNLLKNATNSAGAFAVRTTNNNDLLAVDTGTTVVATGYTTTTSQQLGNTTAGTLSDAGGGQVIIYSDFTTGPTAGMTKQISAYAKGPIDSSPNNQFKLAVYANDFGPTTLMGQTNAVTLVQGWNTVSLSVNLAPNTKYSLAYMTNTPSTADMNSIAYVAGGQRSTENITSGVFASGFPATANPSSYLSGIPSYYVDFVDVPMANLTSTSTGKVGVNMNTPTTTLQVAGNVLFKNIIDSSTAFQINNASAGSLFIADTTNSRIQVGSATADATAIVFVLDTKNTAGDPTGVNGAMYYNSSLGKIRCYEASMWKNCIGGIQTPLTLASNFANTTTSYVTIPDLSMPVVSGSTYRVSALISYNAALTTTGSRWSLCGPATSILSYTSKYNSSATAQTTNFLSAFSLPAAATTGSLATGNTAKIKGIFTASANGTVSVCFASGAAGSAITALAGSSLLWW